MVERTIMVMLIKVFAIRSDARVRFGFASKRRITWSARCFEFLSTLKSVGRREKNATSEPEINAEQNKKIKINTS